MANSDLILNARFLMRPATGVDRVAAELARALIDQAPERVSAIHPQGRFMSDMPDLQDRKMVKGVLTGPLWEQTTLARIRPDAILLSLCNSGPVMRRRQAVMIHDAQVFTQPDSYSAAFRAWYRFMLPRLGHRAGLILTPSAHTAGQLESHGIIPPGRARAVPNGADHILRAPADPETMRRFGLTSGAYFLAIGSLAPHKNLSMLAQAARDRRDQSLPLVLAGGGNPQVFRDAGIAPSPGLRMTGRVTDGELRALYENARALVFPSRTEGFGLPPVEAMVCGCPVIATTCGAVPEVCGDAAMLVDPEDPSAWTKAMEQVAADTDLRAALTAKGRAHAAQYTWEKAAQTLLRHLDDAPMDHAV
jgi:glycosyltransferase involved in cell wall biosynthesis